MRGHAEHQGTMWVAFNLEDRVPADHPLRPIKAWCDRVLAGMSRDFNRAYSRLGRRSIPPEQLLKALVLQSLFSIPSERKLVEAIEYSILYRWFLDLPLEDRAWTPEVFSMNRQRFVEHDLARKFFDRVLTEAIGEGLVSEDHFTIDGTLIRSLASQKSLKPIDQDEDDRDDHSGGRDQLVDWRGKRRSNATHRSKTDPEARLARKGWGKEAHLSHSGHLMMENRYGLCVAVAVDQADGHAERRCARKMVMHVHRRHGIEPLTVGLDAGYVDGEFLAELELERGIVPHVPIPDCPILADDEGGEARRRARRRRRTVGYRLSQRVRKRIEQIFGWAKTTGNLARTRFIGRERIELEAVMTGAAYNLIRMANLLRPT